MNFSSKRYKMATLTNFFLGGVTIYAMYSGLETVASTAIAGILTITTMFIGGDSYRKTDK